MTDPILAAIIADTNVSPAFRNALAHSMTCPVCNGLRWAPDKELKAAPCRECLGTGKVMG